MNASISFLIVLLALQPVTSVVITRKNQASPPSVVPQARSLSIFETLWSTLCFRNKPDEPGKQYLVLDHKAALIAALDIEEELKQLQDYKDELKRGIEEAKTLRENGDNANAEAFEKRLVAMAKLLDFQRKQLLYDIGLKLTGSTHKDNESLDDTDDSTHDGAHDGTHDGTHDATHADMVCVETDFNSVREIFKDIYTDDSVITEYMTKLANAPKSSSFAVSSSKFAN